MTTRTKNTVQDRSWGDSWAGLLVAVRLLNGFLLASGQKGGLMARGIKLTELPTGVREKVESKSETVPGKLVVLGKVLQLFQGMDRCEALCVLRRARNQFV